ncbi:MAG TPA: methyltransferase domain-containing protein [Nitrospiraceae bacterium]|nr:methyltransferase domain-containing protein [Nitrospiraceae bacterium]
MISSVRLKQSLPEPLKAILRPIRNRFVDKYASELSFWKWMLDAADGTFKNSHYERLMLAMAEEPSDDFLRGKIVSDFGCGPMGSLVWAKSASLRIGIDVLADCYSDKFTSNILSHGMVYLKCTEKVIPLPSNFVDVMFTLNAIDHVDYLSIACSEILRVMKPGGDFIGSFNLEEPATPCEPQRLNEKIIRENLLNFLDVRSCRMAARGTGSDPHAPFFEGNLRYEQGQRGFLWVRATKPG